MIQKQTKRSSTTAQHRRKSNVQQNERIDSILLRLETMRSESGYGTYVLGVCGCDRRAGVSTVAANLAMRAAEMSLGKVLLIDANLNYPRQASYFRLGNSSGFADVLTGAAEVEATLRNGVAEGLSVMGAGKPGSVQRVALSPDLVSGLMNELRADFDIIIMDLPPIRNSARSMLLARQIDGALLILNAQQTRARDAEAAIETLKEGNVKIIGSVLNRARRTLPRWLDRWL